MAPFGAAKISRANHELETQRKAAKQATLKRGREESEAHTAGKEPCLCTRDGAVALLRESQQQTREALVLAKKNGKAATGLMNVFSTMMHAAREPGGLRIG